MFFRIVYKSGQIFLPFCHNPRVWQTDRRTDGQTDGRTEISSQYRGCITCSAVKTTTVEKQQQLGTAQAAAYHVGHAIGAVHVIVVGIVTLLHACTKINKYRIHTMFAFTCRQLLITVWSNDVRGNSLQMVIRCVARKILAIITLYMLNWTARKFIFTSEKMHWFGACTWCAPPLCIRPCHTAMGTSQIYNVCFAVGIGRLTSLNITKMISDNKTDYFRL